MKIIFMGTPDFSTGCLRALVDAGHEVVLAVTQPDKPKGRGNKVVYSPVKEEAIRLGIPVFQPVRIREPEAIEYLKPFGADVIVVVAFGQILPKEILDMPQYGCVNVHASLLPKYRGAAPIQEAVLNGDAVSGVTTMQMDVGMDTGDILLTKEVKLDRKETGGSLFDKLSEVGASLCVETLAGLRDGTVTPIPQDDSQATYTRMIRKSDGEIDFSKSARQIECLIRGMNPWPSAYTTLDGKTLKIWEADALTQEEYQVQTGTGAAQAGAGEAQTGVDAGQTGAESAQDGTANTEPAGQVLAVKKDAFYVRTGDGVLKVTNVQLQGKKRMDAGAFLRGYSLAEGTVL